MQEGINIFCHISTFDIVLVSIFVSNITKNSLEEIWCIIHQGETSILEQLLVDITGSAMKYNCPQKLHILWK